MSGDYYTLPSGCTIDADTWDMMTEAHTWHGYIDGRMYHETDLEHITEAVGGGIVRGLMRRISEAGFTCSFDDTGGGCYVITVPIAEDVEVGVTGTDVFTPFDLDSDEWVTPEKWCALRYVNGEQDTEPLGGKWELTTPELLAALDDEVSLAEEAGVKLVTRAAVLAAPVGIEAKCTRCGETFNPADEDDTEHVETVQGTPCGGLGVITGSWHNPTT